MLDVSGVLFVGSGARCSAHNLRFEESEARMPDALACSCPHAVVHMLLSTCLQVGVSANTQPASQPAYALAASSQSAFSGPAVASVQFSSVQLSVIAYRLSVIGRKWARGHVLYPDAGAGADREPDLSCLSTSARWGRGLWRQPP